MIAYRESFTSIVSLPSMRRYSADKLAPAEYALPPANSIRIILCYNKAQMYDP